MCGEFFVASHSMALAMVNSRRGGFGPYQYLLICLNSLATPVAPSGVSERKPKGGQYEIPFPVVFRDDSWWNARTGEELDAFIAGWRPADHVE
jgi:hypothetical protein